MLDNDRNKRNRYCEYLRLTGTNCLALLNGDLRLRGRSRLALVLFGALFVGFCSYMGAQDRSDQQVAGEPHVSFLARDPVAASPKPSRDEYGNLLLSVDQGRQAWKYSGPDKYLTYTKSVMTRLKRRCPDLDANWTAFTDVEASYAVLQRIKGLEKFAGQHMLLIGFYYSLGAISGPLSTTNFAGFVSSPADPDRVLAVGPSIVLCGLPWTSKDMVPLTLPSL